MQRLNAPVINRSLLSQVAKQVRDEAKSLNYETDNFEAQLARTTESESSVPKLIEVDEADGDSDCGSTDDDVPPG